MKTGTSYFAVRIPRHVAADMDLLVRDGFSYVCHTFSENDMTFYHPTMKEILRITRDKGLEIYLDPWGVGKVFGGEAFSSFVGSNLDALQVLSDGKPAGLACPMHPKFRVFMKQWIESAAELQPDVLFWDEPHFSVGTWVGDREGQWGCRCDICKAHFHERFGFDMPNERTPEVHAYLEWAIHDFLSYVIAEGAACGLRNALCLLPHESGTHGAVDNWNSFAAIKGLNIIGTDPYFELFGTGLEQVEQYSRRVRQAADENGIESEVWFQGFKIASGREPLQTQAVDIAAAAGISRLAVWGFEACDHLGWVRPDNPPLLWKTFVDKFAELQNAPAR